MCIAKCQSFFINAPAVINVRSQQEAIIHKTIEIIDVFGKESLSNLSEAFKKITAYQHKNASPDKKRIEEIQLFPVSHSKDIHHLANNISIYTNDVLHDKNSTDLRSKLHSAVYNAVKYSLNQSLRLDEVIGLACALDHINYTQIAPSDTIFQTIIDQMKRKMEANKHRSAALDAWAVFSLRKVKANKMPLFNTCCYHIMNKIKDLPSLEISLAVKGFVQAGFKKYELFSAIKEETVKKKDLFTVNETVNTLWAFCYKNWAIKKDPSLIRKQNQELVEAFKFKLIDEMDTLCTDQAVRIAWTFQRMNITDAQFFNAVQIRIGKDIENLTSKSLINITKLLSGTKGIDDHVLVKLLEAIKNKLTLHSYFTPFELAQVTYAVLMKFCQQDENFLIYKDFIEHMMQCMAVIEPSEWDNQHRGLIKIIMLIYTELPKSIEAGLNIEKDHMNLLQTLIIDFKPQQSTFIRSSDFHLDVKKHLDLLLSEFKNPPQTSNEYPFEEYFNIDIAIPDCLSGFEIDGHCHFDEKWEYMAKNILKETVLKIKNWDLVRLSRKEWPAEDDYKDAQYDEVKRRILLDKYADFSWFIEMEKS